MRVGIFTGGGDCPGLNAVIRAVAKSLMLRHDAEVIGFEDGMLGLIEHRFRRLTYRDVSGILTQGGTILGTSNKANPFSFYKENGSDVSEQVMKHYHALGLDAVVAIGGDGTMSMMHQLSQMGMNVVGVPKTIDNDLVGTERTFGFDTAVAIATEALDRLHTTAQSHHRVIVVETMGRYAGWIALHSALASGADVILIPEIPFSIEEIAAVCRKREQGGQQFTIIVAAEGAHPQGGAMAVHKTVEDSPDPIRLGGICRAIEYELEHLIESEIRTTILGHVQRGGTPTAFDRVLATAFGAFAAQLVEERKFGCLVALQDNHLTKVALEDVANRTRTVPMDSPLIAAALAAGTSFGVPDLYVPFRTERAA